MMGSLRPALIYALITSILLALAVACTAEPQPQNEPVAVADADGEVLEARLQQLVDDWRRAHGVPGVVLTVSPGSAETITGASGMADRVDGRPIDEDEQFEIASITKTFVAATVLQLAQEGKLSLDEPVASYIDAFPMGSRITVRQLLAHRSGLAELVDDRANFEMFGSDLGRRWSTQELVALVALQEPVAEPGAEYRYGDVNYTVTAALVEAVTGSSLADVLRARFFEPLQLDDTFYSGLESRTKTFMSGYLPCSDARYAPPIQRQYGDLAACRDGYIDLAEVPGYQRITFHVGAAGIVSTSGDLMRWGRALFGGNVINEHYREEMLSFEENGDYGLGVMRVATPLGVAYGHSGGSPGMETLLLYVPEQDLALVAAANGGDTGKLRLLVEDALAVLAGQEPVAQIAGQTVNELIVALQAADPRTRQEAAMELGRKGPGAQQATEELVMLMLDDPTWEVRAAAALALGLIGPQSQVAEPLRRVATDDGHEQVRSAARSALELLAE